MQVAVHLYGDAGHTDDLAGKLEVSGIVVAAAGVGGGGPNLIAECLIGALGDVRVVSGVVTE